MNFTWLILAGEQSVDSLCLCSGGDYDEYEGGYGGYGGEYNFIIFQPLKINTV